MDAGSGVIPGKPLIRRAAPAWTDARHAARCILLACALALPASCPARGAEPTSAPGTADAAALVQQLGDRSFPVRAEASRRLCALGAAARPALEPAARSSDPEIALRARALLEVIDQLLFAGCKLELAVSKPRIRWEEPVNLTLAVSNVSTFPATLPFEPSAPATQPAEADGAQVAALLDLADLIEITGPEGTPVPLYVDPPAGDPAVEAAVRSRADAEVSGRLEPGRSLRVAAPRFNRGWARYPLLRAGVYRITIVYAPDWDDEEFTRAGIGGVRSNTVEVEVTEGAPAAVTGAGAAPALVLVRDGEEVVARIENRQDLPIVLNLNLAGSGPPAAALRWIVYIGDDWQEVAPQSGPAERTEFTRDRLIELPPGGGRELGRAGLAALRAKARLKDGEPLFVRLVYTNLADRAWQRRQKDVPAELREPLPARLLLTTLSSEPLRID